MIFHSNTTSDEFINWLRYAAIDGGQPTAFIDCIDKLIAAPSQDEIDEQIDEAVEKAEKKAFENGREDGLADKDNAVEDAEKEMYATCVAAIEARGESIGLTKEQVDKVVNHILWDCRP